MDKEPVLAFDPSIYRKISNPSFSINNSIVLRGETYEGEHELVVCFDNSLHGFTQEKLQPILEQFKLELDEYYS